MTIGAASSGAENEITRLRCYGAKKNTSKVDVTPWFYKWQDWMGWMDANK